MSAWSKECPGCRRILTLKHFYKRSLGCSSSPGMPYGECKRCHHERTNDVRRRRRSVDPTYRARERAATKRWYEKKKRKVAKKRRRA